MQINSHPTAVEISLQSPTIDTILLHNFIRQKEAELNDGLDSLDADLVAAYLYNRDYSKALELAEKLFKKFPNTYNVVINYAVSLELNGKYQDALIYLRKAMKINMESHYGSEWIHEKILEFVISGSKDYSRSILGYDFGNDSIPIEINRKKYNYKDLEYQLNERIYFVKDKDPLFGSLIFDLANMVLIFENKSVMRTFSPILYGAAKTFGFKSPVLDKRIAWLRGKGEIIYSYDKMKRRDYKFDKKPKFKTPVSEIKPDINLKGIKYNQTIDIVGLVVILLGAFGFLRLLFKKT